MQTYQQREEFLYEMAKKFVEKIKLAYGNFIRAHITHQILKSKAPDMLAEKIVERYINSVKVQEEDEFGSKFVEKIADLLFLVETFHMMAYRVGYSKYRCLKKIKL